VHERISKLRDENPQLVKIQYWTFLEDHLYSDFDVYLRVEYHEIENLKDVDYWLEILEFAHSKKFKPFQQGVVEHVIIKIIESVATGSIDFENGIKHLRSLLPQLRDTQRISFFYRNIEYSTTENLQAIAKMYDFLLREIIWKRRFNYDLFYGQALRGLFKSMADYVVERDSVDDQLSFLKTCLKWLYILPYYDIRRMNNVELQKICIVDETIRDVFYRNGFFPDGDCLKDVTERLSHGCSVNFRKACESILFSHKGVSETDEL
jgi:hypothetical protein